MSTDPQNTKVHVNAALNFEWSARHAGIATDELSVLAEEVQRLRKVVTQGPNAALEAQNERLRELVRAKDEALTFLANFHAPYWPMSVAEEALALTPDNFPTAKKGGAA